MQLLNILNKILGALLLTLLFIPLIILITISRLFNFIDFLYRGQIARACFSLIVSPLTALITAVLGSSSLFEQGLRVGLVELLSTFPMRTRHFFSKQLFFGSQRDESVQHIFVNAAMPSGLDMFVTSGFFGKLTLKLLSLCSPMEVYLAYTAKTVSPHNDVSLYFTEQNLRILKQRYGTEEQEQSVQILEEIGAYLTGKLNEARAKIVPGASAGRLQSIQDELSTIEAAQRCLVSFTKHRRTAFDLHPRLQCTSAMVLSYVWLAIDRECPYEEHRKALKEKLIWTLFQIQRGFNIVNGGEGIDIPECPTGAIGLLIRVICDEQEKMPDSPYSAPDPSPANLSLTLKYVLDRPFVSSYGSALKGLRQEYVRNPGLYKQKQRDTITRTWKNTFGPLLDSGVLQEGNLTTIINTGINDWEPPAEEEEQVSQLVEYPK